MKIEQVTFISTQLPHPTLVSYALFPEYGVPLVATIVRDAGYDVKLYVEHIGPIQWDRVFKSDVVCFHSFTASIPKTIETAGLTAAFPHHLTQGESSALRLVALRKKKPQLAGELFISANTISEVSAVVDLDEGATANADRVTTGLPG